MRRRVSWGFEGVLLEGVGEAGLSPRNRNLKESTVGCEEKPAFMNLDSDAPNRTRSMGRAALRQSGTGIAARVTSGMCAYAV